MEFFLLRKRRMKAIKRYVSFATMTLLVFVGSSLLGLFGGVSTGPNLWCFIGFPAWVVIHRGSGGVSFEDFNVRLLVSAVCLSTLLTWGLSKLLHDTRQTI